MHARSLAGSLLALTLAVACTPDEPSETGPEAQAPAAREPRHEIDPEEVERLRALGYAGVAEPVAPDTELGVLLWDRAAAQPGLNLFTNATFCSTQLITLAGEVVHEWSHEPCFRWMASVLAPDGDLLVVGRLPHDREDTEAIRNARYLMRLSWQGERRWTRRIPVHHDVALRPDGRIVSLTYGWRSIPQVHASIPVRDHSLAILDADGALLEEASLYDLLSSAPDVLSLVPVAPRTAEKTEEIDLLHANSVEWMRRPELAESNPIYGENNVLVCLRSQDLLVIVDWAAKRPVWVWGRGEISGPHDASLLPDGHVLVFDNGLGRGWSRVLELDPVSREIVWQYRAPEPASFYTRTRGTAHRLRNGNTLITESDNGRAFEVTPAGRVVWRFLNFNLTRRHEPSVLSRMRRIGDLDFEQLSRRVEAGLPLPRVD